MEQTLYILGLSTLGWFLGYYMSRKNHMRRGMRRGIDSAFTGLTDDGVLELQHNADGSKEIIPGTKSIYQDSEGNLSIRDYLDSKTKE